jgi:hypothetical protein
MTQNFVEQRLQSRVTMRAMKRTDTAIVGNTVHYAPVGQPFHRHLRDTRQRRTILERGGQYRAGPGQEQLVLFGSAAFRDMRSRAVSLPASCWRATARWVPEWRASSFNARN